MFGIIDLGLTEAEKYDEVTANSIKTSLTEYFSWPSSQAVTNMGINTMVDGKIILSVVVESATTYSSLPNALHFKIGWLKLFPVRLALILDALW